MSLPTCEERLRLLLEYQRLTQAYSTTIGYMVVTGISQAEYERLCLAIEKARQDSVDARKRLDRHIAEHGCLIGTLPAQDSDSSTSAA